MDRCLTRYLIIIYFIFIKGVAIAQLPVEVFVGNKKATADIMFFRYFKNRNGQNTQWLFFNRNRVSIDYAMTDSSFLPQFGFTEAISYNNKNLKGFAPVAVIQISNKGTYPKTGFQYSKINTDFTLFSWLVSEVLKKPNIDFFFLGRYTPRLNKMLNLFTQLELVSAFPTTTKNNFNFIQRIRCGLELYSFQFGVGTDLTQNGRKKFTHSINFGGFLRYEF